MTDHENRPEDDLVARARALQDKVEQVSRKSSQEQSSGLGDYLSNNPTIAGFMRFARALKRWTGPIGSFVAWLFGLIGAGVKFAAFRREDGEFLLDSDGDLIFSSRRLINVAVLALAGLVFLHVALSAVYFYSTYFHEMVYVTGKQEIETGEKYQFGGCTSLPCSTVADNGKFYLIETSLYFPMLFYPEEEVFANIPQQNGACDIEGYGIYFRTLRWLYKHAQLYQHVVQVSCRPYTEDEIRQAVESGEIIGNKEDGAQQQ
jgi:hypothetical protein